MSEGETTSERLDQLEERLLRELRTHPPEGLVQHPADHELAELHANPERVGAADAARLRQHLRSCGPCHDAWDAFTALALEQRGAAAPSPEGQLSRLREWIVGRRLAASLALAGAAGLAAILVLGTPDRGTDPGRPALPVAERTPAADGPLRLVTAADILRAELRASEPAGVRILEEGGDLQEGPRVSIASPDPGRVYDRPFPIDVEFVANDSGAEPAMETLRVTYRRYMGVDVTERLRD